MTRRVLLLAAWALLGASLTFVSAALLDELGVAIAIAAIVAGLPIAAIRLDARNEAIGLAAGPGALFVVVAEVGDAPGLAVVGLAILAAAAAVYFQGRSGPAREKRSAPRP